MKRKFMVTCNTTLFDEKPTMKESFYTEDPTSKRTIKPVYSIVKSIVWNRLLRGIFGLNKPADKKIMHVIYIRELRSLIPESYSDFLEDFLIFFSLSTGKYQDSRLP
jgi:MarR-like DNA-binding transcriptional regulator SgrR of sgrS sRNA